MITLIIVCLILIAIFYSEIRGLIKKLFGGEDEEIKR